VANGAEVHAAVTDDAVGNGVASGSAWAKAPTKTPSAAASLVVPARTTPRVVRGLRVLLVGCCVGYVGWLLAVPQQPSSMRDVWLSSTIQILATLLIAFKAVFDARDRIAWGCLAVGVFVWSFADMVYVTWISRFDPVPYPSIADWLYLALYPFAIVAVVLLFLNRLRHPPITVWLDGLLVALGTAAFVWLRAPIIFDSSEATGAATFVSWANPASDTILLCLFIGFLGVLGWRADRMWWYMFAGTVMLWMTDTAWLLGVADSSYSVGALMDAGWAIAFAVMAFAAWQRPRQQFVAASGLRAAVVPLVATAAAFGLLLYATRNPMPMTSIVLAAGAILVGAGRLAQAFRRSSVEAEAHRQAHTDDLTGLPNRRLMNLRINEVLAACVDHEQLACGVILMDVDGFKEINDSLGHAAGDEVLQALVPRLAAGLRAGDTLARLGGDEFAILLGPGSDVSAAIAVAKRIRLALTEPIHVPDLDLDVDVSLGIATYPTDCATREELLRCADMAMYRAKRFRLGHAVYDDTLDGMDRGRLLFVQQLRRAVGSEQIVCDFQPILALDTGEVAAVEALVRWRHPNQGLLHPDAFLADAERAGLMRQLTERVLNIALEQAARWEHEGVDIDVAVNLSMTNLLDEDLPESLSHLLQRHQVTAERVVLEITETAVMHDPVRIHEVLDRVRSLGFAISIDDYGSGYATLAQVRELRASELKLDRSFVTGLSVQEDIHAVVLSTVELAHELGLRMVAEGVESESDLAELKAMGCDRAQGYYICPPGPADEIGAWVRAESARIS
jgi:diguanylate cyclase